jgi:hypothetical protein
MDYVIKQVRKPISDVDILRTIRTRVIEYEKLSGYKKMDDIFINDSCVLFIRNPKGAVGHWVCVVRRVKYNRSTISYFDSYGRPPDPDNYLAGEYPYLSKLMYECPHELEYNEYNYQKAGTATCGRHVIVRILMKNKSLDEYNKFMSLFKNDDELVTAITSMIRK